MHLLDRLLGVALTLLAAAIALHWAWMLLRPLAVPLCVGAVVVGLTGLAWHRRTYW